MSANTFNLDQSYKFLSSDKELTGYRFVCAAVCLKLTFNTTKFSTGPICRQRFKGIQPFPKQALDFTSARQVL